MARKPSLSPKIYTRHGSDYIRIRRNSRDRWLRLGPTGSPEATQAYHRVCAEIAEAGVPAPRGDGITVAEAVEGYLAVRQGKDRQPNLYRRRRAMGLVARLYGLEPLTSIGPKALKTIRAQWVGEKLGRRYILAMAKDVKHFLWWCVEQELLPPEYALRLQYLSRLTREESPRPAEVQPVERSLVEATLPHLPDVARAMVQVQLLTGARPGEICALRPCEVDFEWMQEGGVWVWLYSLGKHKNQWRGHRRDIPLGPKAQLVLRPWLGEPEAPCFTYRRRQLCTQTYGNLVRRACDRARLERWHPNQLRHRAATDVDARYGAKAAQHLLGHAGQETTKIYVAGLETAGRIAAEIG